MLNFEVTYSFDFKKDGVQRHLQIFNMQSSIFSSPPPAVLTRLGQVLQVFFANGGAVIDSSPMYGNSETIVGNLLKTIPDKDHLFAATRCYSIFVAAGFIPA